VEKAFSNCPRNDVRIILGDFNGQEGFENQGRMVVGTVFTKKVMIMD
jgi:hypothetical protein